MYKVYFALRAMGNARWKVKLHGYVSPFQLGYLRAVQKLRAHILRFHLLLVFVWEMCFELHLN